MQYLFLTNFSFFDLWCSDFTLKMMSKMYKMFNKGA